MAKKTIDGFIVARQYDWDEQPTFSWMPYDPTEWDKDTVVVAAHSVDIDVPDNFDIRPFKILTLERRKTEIQRKFAEEVASIDDQIKKLLALTNEVKGEQE